jgi:hypothetical protein
VDRSARERLLSQAYEELQASLSAILYEEDPLGAGSSVGSPNDEYDGEAARLAASLRQTDGDARTALSWVFGEGDEALFTEQLPVRVSDAWRLFSEKISRS